MWHDLPVVLAWYFILLTTEPLLVVFALYLALVDMEAFPFFTSTPFIFGGTFAFGHDATYLAFVSIAVGLFIYVAAIPLFGMLVERQFRKVAAERKPCPSLGPMLVWTVAGIPPLLISLFWMA